MPTVKIPIPAAPKKTGIFVKQRGIQIEKAGHLDVEDLKPERNTEIVPKDLFRIASTVGPREHYHTPPHPG